MPQYHYVAWWWQQSVLWSWGWGIEDPTEKSTGRILECQEITEPSVHRQRHFLPRAYKWRAVPRSVSTLSRTDTIDSLMLKPYWWKQGYLLNTLHTLVHFIPKQLCKVGTGTAPTFNTRNRRLREIEKCAQGHICGKQWRWVWNPGSRNPGQRCSSVLLLPIPLLAPRFPLLTNVLSQLPPGTPSQSDFSIHVFTPVVDGVRVFCRGLLSSDAYSYKVKKFISLHSPRASES